MPRPDEETRAERPGPPAEPATSAFSAGTVLCDRYLVHRLLAQGGMGEVYEAEDVELHERVALKTVLPEIAFDPAMVERFKREIQLARRVTHPNVARVYDLGLHRAGAVPVAFLTMELLGGETLADRLQRGRLDREEALPLVEQMAAGLAAAHQAGIVHRDFKSANIMLVPTATGTRVAVTDFGIAHGGRKGDSGPGHAGFLVGTPDYMAPEQVSRGALTPATDVYALGVVMFEMVTGRRPFQGSSPVEVAVQRLRVPPPSPCTLRPGLDPHWEATILRCLAREPQQRFQDVGDVPLALRGLLEPPPRPASPPRRGLAVALGLLGVLAAATVVWRAPAPERAAAEQPARRSAAVLGFTNLSGRADTQWLAPALTQMLASELAASGRLRVLPGESVARMRLELAVTDAEAGTLAPDTLQRVRTRSGADLAVLGSYLAAGGARRLRVDVRVQDAKSGETVATAAESGAEDDLLEVVARTGAALRQQLGLQPLGAEAALALRSSRPARGEGARLYAEGLDALWRFEALLARDRLQRAVALEPDFPLAHAALAQAWSALGHEEEARAAAERALARLQGLSREDTLVVEARCRLAMREPARAAEAYRALFAFAPDELEYGLGLARAQYDAREWRAMLQTVATLRRLPPPAGQDPRLDLLEAWGSWFAGDYGSMDALARTAEQKGERLQARLLVARARFEQGQSLLARGRTAEARDRYEAAARLFTEVGDAMGAAMARNLVGLVLREDGDLPAAQAVFEEVRARTAAYGHNLWQARALGDLGAIHLALGDLPAARGSLEEALRIRQALHHRHEVAENLYSLALLEQAAGHLAEAEARARESLQIAREIDAREGLASSAEALAAILLETGRAPEAEALLLESESVRADLGNPLDVAQGRLSLARLRLRQGRAAEAAGLSTAAAETYRREGKAAGEAAARALFARAALAQGEREAAATAARRALALAGQSPEVELRAAVMGAAALAGAGVEPAALDGLLTDAERRGLLSVAASLRGDRAALSPAAPPPGR